MWELKRRGGLLYTLEVGISASADIILPLVENRAPEVRPNTVEVNMPGLRCVQVTEMFG